MAALTLIVTEEHLQTIRKAVVKQLQRAKDTPVPDGAEAQRCKDVLNTIDIKLQGIKK